MTEEWVDIPGFETQYQVSSIGNVRSLDRETRLPCGQVRRYRGRPLKPVQAPNGYLVVTLGRRRKHSVHRLVNMSFNGPPPLDKPYTLHSNGDARDNRRENLRWGSPSDNMYDRVIHGNNHEANKTHCPRGHLLERPNLEESEITRGARRCLACRKEYFKAKWAERPFSEGSADRIYEEIMRGYDEQ